jgi:molybdopterin-guanine dinucleotide biosynthesis protein A
MELQIYILAGGKSSRMGEDKGLIMHNGIALVRHVIDAAIPLGTPIKFIGAPATYHRFGYDSIQDSTSEKVLVLPCDMPGIRTSWLRLLIEKSSAMDVLISESKSGAEPLCGVYSCSIRDRWEKSMLNGVLKLTDLIGQFDNGTLKVSEFPFEDQNMFANINTPADLEKLQEQHGLKVIVFGRLVEVLGSRSLYIPAVETVGDLKQYFSKNFVGFDSLTYSVAVNQVIASDEDIIAHGSEVALLPPFSGG